MTSSTNGPFQAGTAATESAPALGTTSGRNTGRYIVRATADDGALGSFIDSLGANPAVRLVETIGPSAGPPHTAVVETDPATAEQLRQRNQHQLTIEPDQPLSLFDQRDQRG